jgi:hypothetical protein
VAAHQVELKLRRLVGTDVDVHQLAEAGVHAVGGPLLAHDPLDEGA